MAARIRCALRWWCQAQAKAAAAPHCTALTRPAKSSETCTHRKEPCPPTATPPPPSFPASSQEVKLRNDGNSVNAKTQNAIKY